MAKKRAAVTVAAAKHAGIGDAAVMKRTGRGWAGWFALLDGLGATKMEHQAIASHLASKGKLDGWWAQMVTVGYEQARGLRVKHQGPQGFEISISKTIGMAAPEAFAAIADPALRRRWLPKSDWTVRTKRAPTRLRATWTDAVSWIEFQVHPVETKGMKGMKEARRCRVVVQHGKLADAAAAAAMKKSWSAALARLAALA